MRRPCSSAPSGTSSVRPETRTTARVRPARPWPPRPWGLGSWAPAEHGPPFLSGWVRGVTGHEEHGDVTVGQGQRAQVPRGADGPSLSLLKRPRGGTVEAAGGAPAGLRSLSDGHEHRGQGTRWTGRAWEAGNPAAEGRGPAGGKGLAERGRGGRPSGRHLRSGTWRPAPPSAPAAPAAHCGRTSAGPREWASVPASAPGTAGGTRGAARTPAREGLREWALDGSPPV